MQRKIAKCCKKCHNLEMMHIFVTKFCNMKTKFEKFFLTELSHLVKHFATHQMLLQNFVTKNFRYLRYKICNCEFAQFCNEDVKYFATKSHH